MLLVHPTGQCFKSVEYLIGFENWIDFPPLLDLMPQPVIDKDQDPEEDDDDGDDDEKNDYFALFSERNRQRADALPQRIRALQEQLEVMRGRYASPFLYGNCLFVCHSTNVNLKLPGSNTYILCIENSNETMLDVRTYPIDRRALCSQLILREALFRCFGGSQGRCLIGPPTRGLQTLLFCLGRIPSSDTGPFFVVVNVVEIVRCRGRLNLDDLRQSRMIIHE